MRNQTTLFILLALALVSGCKNPTVVANGDLGSFRGKVTEYGTDAVNGVDALPLPQQGGVTITIEGTPFTTTSNASSEWGIDNVPAGIYNLIFSKPGFDTSIHAQYQFSGAGTSFLENERINQTRPALLDSIPFTAVVTENDSVIFDTTRFFFALSLICNIAGPDSITIKHFLVTSFDSTAKDSLYEAIVTVPSGRPFTIILTPPWYWYNYYLPNARPGKTYYIGIRALSEGGGLSSPYTVWRKVVLP